MSLEPYHYRPATPDNVDSNYPTLNSSHSRNTSDSSFWSSPDSALTNLTRATTPSPIRQQHGPTLLPKIRTRDQDLEPDPRPNKIHRRALSSNCNPPEHPRPTRPGFQRSTTSPPDCSTGFTPVSTVSTLESWADNSVINSPVTFNNYAGVRFGHSRSTSTPPIDTTALRRYGNPNYRSYPIYTTQSAQYVPAIVPEVADFVAPELALPAPTEYRELTPELQCPGPTTTIMDYLTGPNPPVEPVTRVTQGNGIHPHFWWDIRNLKKWEDFTLVTIMSVPGFSRFGDLSGLLDVPVAAAALPPPRINPSALQPATDRLLQDLLTKFYAAKVNTALKTCQGHTRHITMRPEHSTDHGPRFVSNYATDMEQTFSSTNNRGRVVGIVKTYNDWNTGMRHEDAVRKVLYLAGLAKLQWHMREQGCRYGFIITEIELVCVRMGTESSKEHPYFGFLELSEPIAISRREGLTACLALWYLHMLTSDAPLDGQCDWRVEIGPPAAWSRKKVLEAKDNWIPKPNEGEMRKASSRRGWKWPENEVHLRKEGVRTGRKVVR